MRDDDAKLRLYLAHRTALVEYATPIVGDRMRAEDVVQGEEFLLSKPLADPKNGCPAPSRGAGHQDICPASGSGGVKIKWGRGAPAGEKSDPLIRLKTERVASDRSKEGAIELQRGSVLTGLSVFVRLVAAIGGGYAVAAGLAALAAVALPAARLMPRSEAVVLASMLAFLVYLALLIWAFADRRLIRLCLVLAGAGIASWGGAWGLLRLTAGG